MAESTLRHDLALANRILDNEEVMDAFGHVSARHPERPDHFLLSAAVAPATVEPSDILEFDADGEPAATADRALYAERVIHSEIYRVRPDVHAICHHHSAAILPFCVSGVELVPVSQLGGVIGELAPLWDSREEFGDTDLLVGRPEEAASLARTLGSHHLVLMAHHGATVAGHDLRECVFRAIHSCDNARIQMSAHLLGRVDPLSPGERALAARLKRGGIERCWEYWLTRLRRAGTCHFAQ